MLATSHGRVTGLGQMQHLGSVQVALAMGEAGFAIGRPPPARLWSATSQLLRARRYVGITCVRGGDEAPATYTMFDTIVLLYGWRPPKWMRASLRSVWSHGSGNRPGLCWQARASKRTADGFVQRASRGNTKDTETCAYIVDAFAFMFVVVHIVVLLPHCCRTMGMICLLWVVFVGWRSAARLGRQEATPLLRRTPSAFAAS